MHFRAGVAGIAEVRVRTESIEEVVERQLCTGCGVCAYLEPARYEMANSLPFGRRPFTRDSAPPASGIAAKACPGRELPAAELEAGIPHPELHADWGPVYSVWEGWADDSAVRSAASSGGIASALAAFALESGAATGVLHIGSSPDAPYLNQTRLSESTEALLSTTGSRYSPASPAEGLDRIERGAGPAVFIGKPCDVAATVRAAAERPALSERLALTIGIFCAGTPSTEGNLALLRLAGVEDPATVKSLRFRGHGWPGDWVVEYETEDGGIGTHRMSYAESWGFLQRYRQWRCYICPDHTGEHADVAVGDPWYREVEPGEPGRSLVVARTARGRQFVLRAAEAGYIRLVAEDATLLPRSQPNLLKTRGGLWGRLIALRLANAAVPAFPGYKLFRTWWRELTWREKLQSVLGTAKRIHRKRLRHPARLDRWEPERRRGQR